MENLSLGASISSSHRSQATCFFFQEERYVPSQPTYWPLCDQPSSFKFLSSISERVRKLHWRFLSRATISCETEDQSLDTAELEHMPINSIFTCDKISPQSFKDGAKMVREAAILTKWLNEEPLSRNEEQVVAPFQAVKRELSISDGFVFRGHHRFAYRLSSFDEKFS